MAKRIWVVTELYYPEETSTGYFLTRIAEGLAQHYRVNVLCSQPTYSARGLRAPVRETRNGVSVQRCPATTLNKDVLLYRVINMVTIGFSIFFMTLFRICRDDYVLVVTNPQLLPFGVALACRLRGARCLLLIHDVYPEVLIAIGRMRPGSVSANIVGWLMQRLYRCVDRIIVLGRDMERLVASKLGQSCSRIVIIPNWADLDLISPGERSQNALLAELGLTEQFVVQFAGNMGPTHGLESLLEAATKLRINREIHFLFIGSGAKRGWLEDKSRENGLRNITILPSRPRTELSNLLNACDVAIVSLVSGMAGVSVPSRMYNILAAGKPIIGATDGDSELALAIEEDRLGWVVPPNRPDSIVDAILDARARPDRLGEMGVRARLAAERKYSFGRVMKAYCSMLRSLDEGQQ